MTNIDNIRNAVAEVLEIEPAILLPETNFYDLPNFDSVAILSLIVASKSPRTRLRIFAPLATCWNWPS